jgi:hypothetical protein
MLLFEPFDALRLHAAKAVLANEFMNKRLTAHSNAPVYFPFWQNDARASQSFRPGVDVFVDRVDEGTVNVEEERREAGFLLA